MSEIYLRPDYRDLRLVCESKIIDSAFKIKIYVFFFASFFACKFHEELVHSTLILRAE